MLANCLWTSFKSDFTKSPCETRRKAEGYRVERNYEKEQRENLINRSDSRLSVCCLTAIGTNEDFVIFMMYKIPNIAQRGKHYLNRWMRLQIICPHLKPQHLKPSAFQQSRFTYSTKKCFEMCSDALKSSNQSACMNQPTGIQKEPKSLPQKAPIYNQQYYDISV